MLKHDIHNFPFRSAPLAKGILTCWSSKSPRLRTNSWFQASQMRGIQPVSLLPVFSLTSMTELWPSKERKPYSITSSHTCPWLPLISEWKLKPLVKHEGPKHPDLLSFCLSSHFPPPHLLICQHTSQETFIIYLPLLEQNPTEAELLACFACIQAPRKILGM